MINKEMDVAMEALIRSAFDAITADPELKRRTLDHVLCELHGKPSQNLTDDSKDSKEESD